MYECMCDSVALGPCRECAPAAPARVIDLRINRDEARPDLLAIHDRLVDAGRDFAEMGLGGFAYNAQVPRQRVTRRKRVHTDVVAGWALCTETSPGALEKQIVLLESGEIFRDDGAPQLTREHLTDQHWVIAEYYTIALERYGLSGWPTGVEDPRQLAVEFHSRAAAGPLQRVEHHAAPRRQRWRSVSRKQR